MTSRFTELVVDCHDPEGLAAFWCEVLGFEVIDRSENKVEIGSWVPAVEEVRARQTPPTLLFVRVPEGRTVKNRLHLDVSPVDGSTEDEVTRLLGLGAVRTDVGQGPGRGRVVMADPEGNEFCVLRTLAPQNWPVLPRRSSWRG
ncbi:VOC family protein [Streptomyces sp. NPDC058632]|uniref:VOC family protein n=1 Tax=unclassified Streptomyces TaxID=2593676 RepID=UPI00365E7B44